MTPDSNTAMTPNRRKMLKICSDEAVEVFSRLFALDSVPERPLKSYSGCQNIIYPCSRKSKPHFLRISFRPDRTPEMIASETAFVHFLAEGGAPVARPIASEEGNFVETIVVKDVPLTAVLFTEAPGDFLYRRKFRLPQGTEPRDFFVRQGEFAGRFHALSEQYPADHVRRFDWLARHRDSLEWVLPETHADIKARLLEVIDRIAVLPRTGRNFGICHNDINIGNFTIDYDLPGCSITLFDFDDCGWNYFMYDVACLWECNTGWTFHIDSSQGRRDAMERITGRLLEGYTRYRSLPDSEIALLPLFLKACHIENILEGYRELHKLGRRIEPDASIRFHEACLSRNVEHMGLFDELFDQAHPFEMS